MEQDLQMSELSVRNKGFKALISVSANIMRRRVWEIK